MKVLITAYVIWNIITCAMMGIDKLKAKAGAWRIPEKVLLTVAFAMGAAGSIIGSLLFHHKTRKPKFIIGLPLALCVNIGIAYLVIK